MSQRRRDILRQGGVLGLLLGCGALTLEQAQAADTFGFDAKTMAEALAVLGAAPAESSAVTIASPDIAENGAVVPIAVTSTIPKTEAIYILVEKNPFPMTAAFMIPEGTEPYVATRAKMGESTRVFAVVKAEGKLYQASRETKVTLGGCGG